MYPALQIGPVVLPTAPLTFILGAWIALTLIEQTARQLAPNQVEKTYNLASAGLFTGIIGARIVFVATHWSAYQSNLLGILWPINTGFNVGAGLIIGVGAAFFYGRFHQLDPANTLDILTPGLLIGLTAISLADFLGGPGYGTLSTLPWAISIFGLRRHPVQIYEIIISLAALSLWWHSRQNRQFTGQLFLTALSLYSAGRLFVDAFRDNAPLTAEGYHIIQIISLAILLTALFLLARQTLTNPEEA
ncbi:MAG: prolipoprotein diacylglyceryl transferase [Ardenticatenaceae bacterium]|nr:prolipoprotein diacylglyceryl transferase [Ardenticatenaceae bacterium]